MTGRIVGVQSRKFATRFLFPLFFVLVLAACIASPQPLAVVGDSLRVDAAGARPAAAGQNSAAYLTVVNPTQTDDRLLSASGDVAMAVELHETVNDSGVMRMTPHPEGFAVPASSTLELKQGGKHVMLMGLGQPLVSGQSFTLTLTFEKAGAVKVTVPVLER